MKVFLTGATGFLGTHVLEALQDAGHEVTCFNRRASVFPENLSYFDAVYHCAGVLGKDGLPRQAYADAHVELPRKLMSAMRPDAYLIYVSSAYVTEPKNTSHRDYVLTKLEGESLVKTWTGPWTIIRPGLMYGPRDKHHFPLYKWIANLGSFCPIFGEGLCAPTYVKDVASALVHPEQLPVEKSYTISGIGMKVGLFMDAIAASLGVGRPFIQVNLPIKRDFFQRDHVFANQHPFQTPLLDGLNETVKWYRKAKWL